MATAGGAARPGLRVTFMSGYTGEPLEAELADVAHFLAKPFKPEALLSTVREALTPEEARPAQAAAG